MNLTILIADDDPVARHILETILSNAGFQVIATSSGGECLDQITLAEKIQKLPDLIFLDFMLSDMTGLETLSRIRKILPQTNIPVIMLSANSESELRVLQPGIEPDIFLEKPFVSQSVLNAIEKLFSKKEIS